MRLTEDAPDPFQVSSQVSRRLTQRPGVAIWLQQEGTTTYLGSLPGPRTTLVHPAEILSPEKVATLTRHRVTQARFEDGTPMTYSDAWPISHQRQLPLWVGEVYFVVDPSFGASATSSSSSSPASTMLLGALAEDRGAGSARKSKSVHFDMTCSAAPVKASSDIDDLASVISPAIHHASAPHEAVGGRGQGGGGESQGGAEEEDGREEGSGNVALVRDHDHPHVGCDAAPDRHGLPDAPAPAEQEQRQEERAQAQGEEGGDHPEGHRGSIAALQGAEDLGGGTRRVPTPRRSTTPTRRPWAILVGMRGLWESLGTRGVECRQGAQQRGGIMQRALRDLGRCPQRQAHGISKEAATTEERPTPVDAGGYVPGSHPAGPEPGGSFDGGGSTPSEPGITEPRRDGLHDAAEPAIPGVREGGAEHGVHAITAHRDVISGTASAVDPAGPAQCHRQGEPQEHERGATNPSSFKGQDALLRRHGGAVRDQQLGRGRAAVSGLADGVAMKGIHDRGPAEVRGELRPRTKASAALLSTVTLLCMVPVATARLAWLGTKVHHESTTNLLQPTSYLLNPSVQELGCTDFDGEPKMLEKDQRHFVSKQLKGYLDHLGEVYSPPRVTKAAKGLRGSIALDLTTGWDFCVEAQRQRARELIYTKRPAVLILSPPCRTASPLRRLSNFKRNPRDVEAEEKEGRLHLDFSIELAEEQMRRGLGFILEQPQSATSWQHPRMQRLLQNPEVTRIHLDMCQFGLRAESGPFRGTLAKKPTLLCTNIPDIRDYTERKCLKNHRHGPLLGGSAQRAAIYTPQFCEALVKGIKQALGIHGKTSSPREPEGLRHGRALGHLTSMRRTHSRPRTRSSRWPTSRP